MSEGVTVHDEPLTPVRRRIGRRLAFVTGVAALVLGVVVFAAVLPYFQREAAERVAADQVGLLAEAVAASYEASSQPEKDATVPDESEKEPTGQQTEHAHRTAEILAQLRQAKSIVAIDVTDHKGTVRQSTHADRVGGSVALPGRLRDARVEGEQLVASYAIPFTRRCAACHDARTADPVGAIHVTVERQAALTSLQRFQWLTAAVVLFTYGLLVLLVTFVTDRLVGRPAFALARLMRRAERGDFLVRARVSGDDELGVLAMAFNRMLRAITTMKAEELERERKLQSAEAQLAMQKELADLAGRLQGSNAALERRVRAQELLMEAAHRLGSTLDKAALLERLTRVITEKLGRPDFVIYLVVESENHEALLEVARASGLLDRDDVRGTRFRVGEGITGLVAETGAPVVVHDLRDPWSRLVTPPPSPRAPLIEHGSLVSVPMLHKGRVVGVLEFYAAQPQAFDEEDAKLLEALGAQAAMAVVNADLYQTTLELSVTDTLTKLMNRRALNRVLEAEFVRAQRFNTPLCVLMLDVDHFKQYNDRMGHLLGDDALRTVAQVLSSSVRKVDAVARFGGEEFCVILPRTDEVAGLDVADKLLKAMRGLELPGADNQPMGRMSISVGLAVYPDDMPAATSESPTKVLLDTADQAAYEAKRRGRDRVVSAGESRPKKPKLHEPVRSGAGDSDGPKKPTDGG